MLEVFPISKPSHFNTEMENGQIEEVNNNYTQYGPIKNGRIKNQGSDFEKK